MKVPCKVIVSVKPRISKAEAAAPPAKGGKGGPEPPPAVGDNPLIDVEAKEVVIPRTSTGTSRASSSRAT